MTTKQRFEHILTWFAANMPVAESELVFLNPFQCLIAVMLSAQCTDKRVNMVTPALFAAYPTPEALASATSDEVFEYIQSISYPRSKAEHLVQMAQRLVEVYNGIVPDNIEDLQTLQGVGRKTANVIRGNIFHDPSIVVDTHVKRISAKLGFTKEKDPEKIEYDLMKVLPKDHWILYNIQIITFGRDICKAQRPECDRCRLTEYCSQPKPHS